MNDPNNPIAKVREAHVAFTAIYKGEDAWNQDVLVNKLENELRQRGWDIRTFHLDSAYDADHKQITEEEMRQYIYRKHGHAQGRCSSCPDPVKWKQVQRLRMQEYYRNREVWDDPKRGRPAKGYNWATGEVERKRISYILETEEERKERLNPKPIKQEPYDPEKDPMAPKRIYFTEEELKERAAKEKNGTARTNNNTKKSTT